MLSVIDLIHFASTRLHHALMLLLATTTIGCSSYSHYDLAFSSIGTTKKATNVEVKIIGSDIKNDTGSIRTSPYDILISVSDNDRCDSPIELTSMKITAPNKTTIYKNNKNESAKIEKRHDGSCTAYISINKIYLSYCDLNIYVNIKVDEDDSSIQLSGKVIPTPNLIKGNIFWDRLMSV